MRKEINIKLYRAKHETCQVAPKQKHALYIIHAYFVVYRAKVMFCPQFNVTRISTKYAELPLPESENLLILQKVSRKRLIMNETGNLFLKHNNLDDEMRFKKFVYPNSMFKSKQWPTSTNGIITQVAPHSMGFISSESFNHDLFYIYSYFLSIHHITH